MTHRAPLIPKLRGYFA